MQNHGKLPSGRTLITGECVYIKRGFVLLGQFSNTVPIYTAFEHTPGVWGLLFALDFLHALEDPSPTKSSVLIKVRQHLNTFSFSNPSQGRKVRPELLSWTCIWQHLVPTPLPSAVPLGLVPEPPCSSQGAHPALVTL